MMKSFQWMEAAANQGNTDAEVEMAEMYIRGEVIPMNARKAKTWYEKAAAKDDLDGINGLARLYRYGSGVRKDQEKAFERLVSGFRKPWMVGVFLGQCRGRYGNFLPNGLFKFL